MLQTKLVLQILNYRHKKKSYFVSFLLQFMYYSLQEFNKELPRIEQKYFVSHDNNDAVPTLKSSGLAVFQKKGVAQNVAPVIVSKKYGAFTPRANLVKYEKHLCNFFLSRKFGIQIIKKRKLNRFLKFPFFKTCHIKY